MSEWERVVEIVCTYLNKLRESDLPEWVFHEFTTSSEMAFTYQEEGEPISYCKELAGLMQEIYQYKPKEILRHRMIYGEFKSSIVKEILSYFTCENLRIFMLSNDFIPDSTFHLASIFVLFY